MESKPLHADTPLDPVGADDLKRVWRLIRNLIADHGTGIGIDARMISEQCGPGTDANAVFFRAALLQHLFEAGQLDDWREGNEPAALVFQVAAVFPMEQGVQGFDPADFIESCTPRNDSCFCPPSYLRLPNLGGQCYESHFSAQCSFENRTR
jgi:hypothetical protein